MNDDQKEIIERIAASENEASLLFKEVVVSHEASEFNQAIEKYDEFLSVILETATEEKTKKTTDLIELFKELAEKEISLLNYEFSDKESDEVDEPEEIDGPNTENPQTISLEDLVSILTEKQNEIFTSLISVDEVNDLFKEALINHQSNEFIKASEIYKDLSTNFGITKEQEELLSLFNQLAENEINLFNHSFYDQETAEADSGTSEEDDQPTDELTEKDSKTEPEISEEDDQTPDEIEETEQEDDDSTKNDERTNVISNLTADSPFEAQTFNLNKYKISSTKNVNYRGYLTNSSDIIYFNVDNSSQYEEIEVGSLQGQEVKILEEADTPQTTWAYIEVVGRNVSGWINKMSIDIESVSSQSDVNYRGYLTRSNDTINTQPWGTPGYDEIRRVEDLQEREVKVLGEAQTQRAAWLYVDIMGTNISGWVDKAGIDSESISSRKDVNYRGYLARPDDTINTQPWGTPGYEEIRRVENLQGTEVKVLEEAKTQRATWVYIDVMGTKISGWIDKAGIEEEGISSQRDVDYRGFLTRPNDTINTQPWGTPGYQEIRRVNDLEDQKVHVTQEATTQRAEWMYINVVGTNITGWIDKAGIEQASVAYRTTYYGQTFEETLNTQMQNGYPQTDSYGNGWQNARREDVAYYLNPENFVNVQNESTPVNIELVQVATGALNVRRGPSTSYPAITTVERNEVYEVLGQSNGWYKIDLGENIGWISSDYVSLISEVQYSNLPDNKIATVNTATLNVRQAPSTNDSIVTQIHNNETYKVLDQSNGWYKIDVNGTEGWTSGKYLNVSDSIDSEALQFLSLSSPSGITVSDLNKELEGKGILENQGAAFIEASRQYNINEIYLVSHALLESGHGDSELSTGVEVNGVTVYNMFGIGAYDGNALEAGSQYAYDAGWDTPRKAIIGGAEFIANSYINSPVHKQDTLYKMKWNPANPSVHQYATDIGWAIKQTNILDQIVELSSEYDLALKFDIPIYH